MIALSSICASSVPCPRSAISFLRLPNLPAPGPACPSTLIPSQPCLLCSDSIGSSVPQINGSMGGAKVHGRDQGAPFSWFFLECPGSIAPYREPSYIATVLGTTDLNPISIIRTPSSVLHITYCCSTIMCYTSSLTYLGVIVCVISMQAS